MKKVVIIDTKRENLEGDVVLLIDPEKVSALSVERSTAASESQKFGIRISGIGFNHFFHISFPQSSKLGAEDQKKFLMKLQARLAKQLWQDSSLEVSLTSNHLGL